MPISERYPRNGSKGVVNNLERFRELKNGWSRLFPSLLERRVLEHRVPAHDRVRDRIGRSEIGLDVEEWRAVETVEADDGKPRSFDPDELCNAHGDRVWPGR